MKKPNPTKIAVVVVIAALAAAALFLAACEQPAGKVLSEDTALKTLAVSAGSLNPAFSAAVADYTVTVANTVESITVTAEAASEKAAVSGAGSKTLTQGDNTIAVTVTAESGAAKTYTITARRLDGSTRLITTAAELAKIGVDGAWPPAGNYALGADITLADWTPVGASVWKSPAVPLDPASTPFTGSFDGSGHTITLQSFAAPPVAVDKAYLGIFSAVKGAENAKAVIKNLKIVSSVTVTSAPNTGQAMGLIAGYTENAEISNITLSGALAFTSTTKNIHLGGVVGYAQKGTVIKDSASAMDVTLNGGAGGGFVANSFYNFVGGFVGIFKDGVDITRCRMTGNVTGGGTNAASQIFSGGIAGGSYYAFTTEYQGSISYCSNTGNVYADVQGFWAWTGGITGVVCGDGDGSFEKTTKVYRCWASGDITSVGKAGQWPYTGGITGYIYYGGMVAECYFTGNVTAKGTTPDAAINDYAGGISGYLSKETGHNSTLRDCWSSGTVNGRVNGGGIVGQHQVATKLYNCWSKAAVTVSAEAGAKGSSSQQGAGGIAGFCAAGDGGDYTEGFAPADLKSCVALNPSVSAPNGFERVGRVIGDSTGTVEKTYGWAGMSVTVSGAAQTAEWVGSGAASGAASGHKSVNGADCDAKPAQSLYEGLGWDFAAVWKMDGDGYPHLRWE